MRAQSTSRHGPRAFLRQETQAAGKRHCADKKMRGFSRREKTSMGVNSRPQPVARERRERREIYNKWEV